MNTKSLKAIKNCFLFTFFLIILFSFTVFADEKSKIILNGIETDIVIGNAEDAFVPLRAFAEMLGCEVSYEPSAEIARAVSGDISIEIKIGSKKANINGGEVEMEQAAYIESGKTMVPFKFMVDAVDGYIPRTSVDEYIPRTHVFFQELNDGWGTAENNGLIEIYTPYPVWFNNKMGKVASKTYYFYEELDETGDYPKYAEYEVCLPYFIDMKTTEAAEKLNKNFENDYKAIQNFAKEEIESQKAEKDGVHYIVTEIRGYRVIGQYKNIVSMVYLGYSYYGGAHGMPIMNGVNLNLEDPYIMPLKDLFVTQSDYKNILLEKINAIFRQNNEGYFTDTVEELPASNSFYIDGSSLIIYYDPYVLGPFATGFVMFEIPMSELSDILKDEYKP